MQLQYKQTHSNYFFVFLYYNEIGYMCMYALQHFV